MTLVASALEVSTGLRHTGSKHPGLQVFIPSLTEVPLLNYSKVYFHFSAPRLRKPTSVRGFSYTVSEMAFQKESSLDGTTSGMYLDSWQTNRPAGVHSPMAPASALQSLLWLSPHSPQVRTVFLTTSLVLGT